ncbi:hypothetical protein [Halorubrum depositum]|uniref:hypothetical protein n=1 Tax=Halorubrum depositum TaxID=2583992 RepID=UPI00119D8FDE|nr:hypothetical protein [Halorubrum depositum]
MTVGERIADSIELRIPGIEITYIFLYNMSMFFDMSGFLDVYTYLPRGSMFLATVIALTMVVSLLNNAINGTSSYDWDSF